MTYLCTILIKKPEHEEGCLHLDATHVCLNHKCTPKKQKQKGFGDLWVDVKLPKLQAGQNRTEFMYSAMVEAIRRGHKYHLRK